MSEGTSSLHEHFEELYLHFALNASRFALKMNDIREILPFEAPQPIPNQNRETLGMISVRNQIFPVLDVHRLFDGQDTQSPAHIIVMEREESLFGFVVDRVFDVRAHLADEIQPVENSHNGLIKGAVEQEFGLVTILSIGEWFKGGCKGANANDAPRENEAAEDDSGAAMAVHGFGERQYLSFRVHSRLMGLPLDSVREVLDDVDLTEVPLSPPCVGGVLNLRGNILPIIRLDQRLGLPPGESSARYTVVVEVAFEDKVVPVGVMVDKISSVVEITAEEAKETLFAEWERPDFFQAVGLCEGEFLMVLNVHRVLDFEELSALAA